MDTKYFAIFLNYKLLLALIVILDAALLILYANGLGVNANEARVFFYDDSFIAHCMRISTELFGQNNIAVRIPFIAMHTINSVLLFAVSRDHLKLSDAFWATGLFLLLPGVNSVALLVNNAWFAIFITLSFLLLYNRNKYIAYSLLCAAVLSDNIFIVLAFTLILYEIVQKRYKICILLAVFIAVSLYFYGYDLGSRPRGYFLDIFGLYGAIFSPFILLYFIYTIYWYPFKSNIKLPLLWYVCTVPFCLSILLSLRQNLPIEDYAPYTVIAAPMMIKAFMNSYRIRLREFRSTQRTIGIVLIATLAVMTLLTFFHKPFYAILSDSDRHFAQQHHFVGELAARLKELGISEVNSSSNSLAVRLKFYGIESGGRYYLSRIPSENEAIKLEFTVLEFTVLGRVTARYYLTER